MLSSVNKRIISKWTFEVLFCFPSFPPGARRVCCNFFSTSGERSAIEEMESCAIALNSISLFEEDKRASGIYTSPCFHGFALWSNIFPRGLCRVGGRISLLCKGSSRCICEAFSRFEKIRKSSFGCNETFPKLLAKSKWAPLARKTCKSGKSIWSIREGNFKTSAPRLSIDFSLNIPLLLMHTERGSPARLMALKVKGTENFKRKVCGAESFAPC